jgi:hypothetical protein
MSGVTDTDEDDRSLLAAHAAGDRHAFGRLVAATRSGSGP